MSDCCGSITVPPKEYAEHELPLVENARKWYDTEYYVITHPYAYSLGPIPYNTPVYVVGLTDHSMYFDADTSEFVVEQLSLEGDWVEKERILIGNIPLSFSFTFDQNGHIAIVWESEGVIYRYWYDTFISDHTTTTVGAGKSPYINMESFNEILKPVRQIIMVYVNANNELVYRLQDDRYTIEHVLYEDVHSVVAFEHTSRNSLKLVYLVHLPPLNYELKSIATERLGEWIGDNASGEVEFIIDALVLRPVVLVLGIEEQPIGLTREIIDVELEIIPSVAELPSIEERPIGLTRGISGVSLIIRDFVYKTYFEEPIPEGLSHTSEFISFTMQDVRVDISQEEPVPPALTHTCGFISYSLNYPKSSLLNLLNYANGLIEGDYTPASWADMIIERDAAQIVYDDAGATQIQVNDAWVSLNDAINALVEE